VTWVELGPAVVVAAGAVVALVVDAVYPRRTWLGSGLPASVATVAAGLELFRTGGPDATTFALSLVLLVGTLFVLVASNVMNFENAMPPGRFHFLLMASASGALVMVAARDLVTLVVGLALTTLPSAALVGLRQGDRRAARSARTYLLASVASLAVTLAGVALLRGVAGTLDHAGLRDGLATTDAPPWVVALAVVLTVVGLLVAIGAVPFHRWVPHAYAGASVMVAAHLSAVVRVAVLGALVVLVAAMSSVHDTWAPLLAVVAALTMTVGTLGALRQRDAVGLLAWSSVAHAGFVLAPASARDALPEVDASLQYLAVYALANLVAFGALAVLLRLRGGTGFADLAGLVRTDPWMGVPLAFAALTLAGLPPSVIGAAAKLGVLRPVVEDGPVWLAVVTVANVVLGLGYCLRLLVVLVARPDGAPYVSPSPPVSVRVAKSAVLLGTAGLVALSVWPPLLLAHLP
jgi:NADH-quinone oxidoreductase subunit N